MCNISLNKILYCIVIFIKYREIVCKVVQDTNRFVLIRNSSIFVDKTILIKKIFQYDFLLLSAPSKFGKTTNLHMIKLFLGNKYKKASVANVFRDTHIWKDREFIVKHLCNYPIIYCDLKPKGAIRTLEDVSRELQSSVKYAFLEHQYLLQSTKIGDATKKRYVQYCKLEVKDFEVGLKFLSKVLHLHHGARATVLIDDFDYSMTYSVFKKDLDSLKVAELLFHVIDNTINLNEYVSKSVVMGRLPFKLGTQFSGLYLLEHFRFMVSKDFTPFFGFTRREIEGLLNKFRLQDFMENVSSWFGGYSYLHSDFEIYNPWSVLMFLKTKKIDIHWVAKASRRMLYKYLEPHCELKEVIAQLIEKQPVSFEAVSTLTSYEVAKLKNVQFASASYSFENKTQDDTILQILLESGYLTYAEKCRTLPNTTQVKFPNLEVQKVFEQILRRLVAAYPDTNRNGTVKIRKPGNSWESSESEESSSSGQGTWRSRFKGTLRPKAQGMWRARNSRFQGARRQRNSQESSWESSESEERSSSGQGGWRPRTQGSWRSRAQGTWQKSNSRFKGTWRPWNSQYRGTWKSWNSKYKRTWKPWNSKFQNSWRPWAKGSWRSRNQGDQEAWKTRSSDSSGSWEVIK